MSTLFGIPPTTLRHLVDYEWRNHDGGVNYLPRMGRSSVEVACPFCSQWVTCYVWSLAGSGKRCSCGATIFSKCARRPK